MKIQKTIKNRNLILDNEEKEILTSLEKGELRDVDKMDDEVYRLSKILSESNKKSKSINIRLVESDLIKIKLMASKNGLPYQTLISTILRQYVTGRIQVHL